MRPLHPFYLLGIFKGKRGLRAHSLNNIQILFSETSLQLVKYLDSSDNLAPDSPNGNAKDAFCLVSRLLINCPVEMFVIFGVVNDNPCIVCEDIADDSGVVEDPYFLLEVSPGHSRIQFARRFVIQEQGRAVSPNFRSAERVNDFETLSAIN